MQVKYLMNTKPSFCEPFWTVEAVALLMAHVGTGILPVVQDVLSHKLIGVVTDRDICVRVVGPGLFPAHIWVRDCMTSDPVCCNAEDDVESALQKMAERQVRRLPVVDERMQLLGMLSVSDIIRSTAVEMQPVYSSLRQICQRSAGVAKPEPLLSHAA